MTVLNSSKRVHASVGTCLTPTPLVRKCVKTPGMNLLFVSRIHYADKRCNGFFIPVSKLASRKENSWLRLTVPQFYQLALSGGGTFLAKDNDAFDTFTVRSSERIDILSRFPCHLQHYFTAPGKLTITVQFTG